MQQLRETRQAVGLDPLVRIFRMSLLSHAILCRAVLRCSHRGPITNLDRGSSRGGGGAALVCEDRARQDFFKSGSAMRSTEPRRLAAARRGRSHGARSVVELLEILLRLSLRPADSRACVHVGVKLGNRLTKTQLVIDHSRLDVFVMLRQDSANEEPRRASRIDACRAAPGDQPSSTGLVSCADVGTSLTGLVHGERGRPAPCDGTLARSPLQTQNCRRRRLLCGVFLLVRWCHEDLGRLRLPAVRETQSCCSRLPKMEPISASPLGYRSRPS